MALVSQSSASEYFDRSCDGCRVLWLLGILSREAKMALIYWWVILSYLAGSDMSSMSIIFCSAEKWIVLYFHF